MDMKECRKMMQYDNSSLKGGITVENNNRNDYLYISMLAKEKHDL